MKTIALSIEDIMKLDSGDFLEQDTEEPEELFAPDLQEEDSDDEELNEEELNEEESKKNPIEKETNICQNECCNNGGSTTYHTFEITDDHLVVICEKCYDNGYRFCIFSHQVAHMTQMDKVLDDMYALPHYHQNQLTPDKMCDISDLFYYFKMIGIDNPSPIHVCGPIGPIGPIGPLDFTQN